jgi:hypothetical protein
MYRYFQAATNSYLFYVNQLLLYCCSSPLQATCGTLGLSTATVKLIGLDGEEKIGCSVGTGPVDAAYKAIDQIIQVSCCFILPFACCNELVSSFTFIGN